MGSQQVIENKLALETERFGQLHFTADQVWYFPEGLPGLEEYHRFVLVSAAVDEPVCWLQSLDEPAIALPVREPWGLLPDYEVTLTTADSAALHLKRPSEAAVFVVLNLRRPPAEQTVNLLAPVVVNVEERLGKQVIMERSRYGLQTNLAVLFGRAPNGSIKRRN